MPAQGTTTADFGAFPGKTEVTFTVSSPTITAGVLVEAWVFPGSGTADHSADEHIVEPLRAVAHSVVAGVGFSVTVLYENQLNEPVTTAVYGKRNTTLAGGLTRPSALQSPREGGRGTRVYGQWNIAWVWN